MKLSISDKLLMLGLFVAVLAVALPEQAAAQAALFDSGTNFLQSIVDLLTNVWARLLAIIAVVFTGFMAMFQRLTWSHAIYTFAGMVIVFGGAAIVDSVQGSV